MLQHRRRAAEPAAECIGVCLPHPHRQGCRHHDRRAAVHRLHPEQCFELALHVGVIGVRFVHRQNPIRQAKQSQRGKTGRQHAHERLVDCSHAYLRQQRTAAVVSEPTRAAGLRRRIIFRADEGAKPRVQRRSTMGQGERGSSREETRRGARHAREHGVGGRHRGQREEQTARAARGDHPMHEDERGLGLAGAGRVFNQRESRAAGQWGVLYRGLHGAQVRQPSQCLCVPPRGHRRGAQPRLRHRVRGLRACALQIVRRGQVRRGGRKPLRIRRHPVRRHGETGERPAQPPRTALVHSLQRPAG